MVVNPVVNKCSQTVTIRIVGSRNIITLRCGYRQFISQIPPFSLHLPDLLHDIVCGEGGVWREEEDVDSQLQYAEVTYAPSLLCGNQSPSPGMWFMSESHAHIPFSFGRYILMAFSALPSPHL